MMKPSRVQALWSACRRSLCNRAIISVALPSPCFDCPLVRIDNLLVGVTQRKKVHLETKIARPLQRQLAPAPEYRSTVTTFSSPLSAYPSSLVLIHIHIHIPSPFSSYITITIPSHTKEHSSTTQVDINVPLCSTSFFSTALVLYK